MTLTKDVSKARPERVGDRQFKWTLSTGDVDRMGDCIDPRGWQLDNYRKNPIVLWAHQYDQLPIAKCSRIGLEGGALTGVAEFPPPGVYPFADQVRALVESGHLRTASVGFRPLEATPATTRSVGMDFQSAELLEWSVVPVPANSAALLQAKATPDLAAIQKWMSQGDVTIRALVPAIRALPPVIDRTRDGRQPLGKEVFVPIHGGGAATLARNWTGILHGNDVLELDITPAELDQVVRRGVVRAFAELRTQLFRNGGR